ncbi:hypothetical protein Agub_g3900, partial [Astrephomene gubernaculifera]
GRVPDSAEVLTSTSWTAATAAPLAACLFCSRPMCGAALPYSQRYSAVAAQRPVLLLYVPAADAACHVAEPPTAASPPAELLRLAREVGLDLGALIAAAPGDVARVFEDVEAIPYRLHPYAEAAAVRHLVQMAGCGSRLGREQVHSVLQSYLETVGLAQCAAASRPLPAARRIPPLLLLRRRCAADHTRWRVGAVPQGLVPGERYLRTGGMPSSSRWGGSLLVQVMAVGRRRVAAATRREVMQP